MYTNIRTKTIALPAAALITLTLLFAMQALLSQRLPELIPPHPAPEVIFKNVKLPPPPPPTTFPKPDPRLKEVPDTRTLTARGPVDNPVSERPKVELVDGPAPLIGVINTTTALEPLENAPPILLRRPAAAYPPIAIRRGLSGYAIVRFDINAAGSATNVAAIEATDAMFARAAVKAAGKLKFRPRFDGGEAVASRGHELKYRFDMDTP